MSQTPRFIWSAVKQLLGPNYNFTNSYKNEYETFQYFWDRSSTIVNDPELWTKVEKSPEAAEKYKLLGNNYCTSKDYYKAENCYLKALSYAKYMGITYGKILSNLALVRFFQGKYQQCIELISMCEKTEYPKNNFPKLHIRKMRAWMKIGDDRNALETFERLKKLLPALKVSESEQKKFLVEANEVLREVPEKKIEKNHDEELIVPEMEGSLTSKANIRKGGVRGTLVRATENIKQGEPILVEQILFAGGVQFCTYCYLPNEVPHVCESCMFVMYCSEQCKKVDAETHKLECPLYQTRIFVLIVPYIYDTFTTFIRGRTFKAFHDFKAFSEDLELLYEMIMDCLIVVHHIMENKQILKMLLNKNIVRSGLDARNTAYEIGKQLLELAVMLQFNREPYNQGNYIVYKIFPKYASFGHSCSPNTSKYFSGNKIVVKAAEDIEAGQEITVAYGCLLYTNIPFAKRQEELQKYYRFNCQCKACQYPHLETELTGVIRCDNCRIYTRFEPSGFVICDNCASAKRLDSEMLDIANFLSAEGHISEDRQKLVEIIERFEQFQINSSNYKVVLAHLALAIQEIDQGNIENAMKIIDRSNTLTGPFNKYIYSHYLIFISLQIYLKTLNSSVSRHRITENISIETVEIIEKFLNAFESLLNLYYPKRQILKGIEEVRKYISIIKPIYTSYNEADKLEWNIVDDDDNLRKTIQMS